MGTDADLHSLIAHLDAVSGRPLADVPGAAVALAEGMQRLANAWTTPAERQDQARLARLMEDRDGRLLTTALTDRALRPRQPARVADQLRYLLRHFGIPRYFPWPDRLALRAFRAVGSLAPRLAVPFVTRRIAAEMHRYVLDADPTALGKQIAERVAAGAHVNVNQLGEAILGEGEAEARLQRYLGLAARPDVACISVKVSSIASQIDLLAEERSLAVLAERLRRLYRAAMAAPYRLPGGGERPKLVTLDMEEYRDLHLTVALFERVLGEPEFTSFTGAIVLQAYLPDSHLVQQRLDAFATARVAAGGAPIRVRLVKGANLAMERVEAAVHGWPQAPYLDKAGTDANYKRMLAYALTPERLAHARLGVASHNLFDVATALVLRAAHDVGDAVVIEMLEGIAGSLGRVVTALGAELLVYAPTAVQGELQSAIAYLIRRLDENTTPENFLRHSFGLAPGTDAWREQEAAYRRAWAEADAAPLGPRRRQDRSREVHAPLDAAAPFRNAPDTDWSLPQNRRWIEAALARREAAAEVLVPCVVGGREVFESPGGEGVGEDPSRPGRALYRVVKADVALVGEAVGAAVVAAARWGATSSRERAAVLGRCAAGLARARGDLITAMVADAGKAVPEGDAEVSEAIDFAEYYRRSLAPWEARPTLALRPLGVVVVAPPWNFPLAIPAGGVLAALMAGDAVILKPAPETVLVGWELASVLWAAGVPRDVLQFVPCDNDPAGSALVADPRVAAVVLTGGTATARKLMGLRPGLTLFAETGGKNATIVTELADVDLAVKQVVHSAFSHSGQKCSATSLLICEAPVYDDASFHERLRDAVESVPVGPSWELGARVTPLIREPRAELMWALTTLDAGEDWLVRPRVSADNPRLWSPGVKVGVRPGSRSHRTEFFGPVLSVMRADSLEHAIELANGTPYGLTAGLQSLGPREQARFIEAMEAGNLYVNRPTTGAVVERQPFGGRKASVWGPGAKAGGPHYVLQLMRATDGPGADDAEPAAVVAGEVFEELDPQRLLGQDNRFRVTPCRAVLVRACAGATAREVALTLAAAAAAGARVVVSAAPEAAAAAPGAAVEGPAAAGARLGEGVERVRIVGEAEETLSRACAAAGVPWIAPPVVAEARLELLRYAHEQAVSVDYHRFGNLGEREEERRRGPAPE